MDKVVVACRRSSMIELSLIMLTPNLDLSKSLDCFTMIVYISLYY
jgi:hypothetical protein